MGKASFFYFLFSAGTFTIGGKGKTSTSGIQISRAESRRRGSFHHMRALLLDDCCFVTHNGRIPGQHSTQLENMCITANVMLMAWIKVLNVNTMISSQGRQGESTLNMFVHTHSFGFAYARSLTYSPWGICYSALLDDRILMTSQTIDYNSWQQQKGLKC